MQKKQYIRPTPPCHGAPSKVRSHYADYMQNFL